MPHVAIITVLVVASLAFTGDRASAQDVRWRHDYAAARREAAETGKPLLLDFGTEACFWCKKLDATTFRDPKVAKLLNERFIPVKIDGDKDERLTQAAKVDSFPTLILATPEGNVLARHPGYADVAQLTALLGKAPAPAAAAPQVAPTPVKTIAVAESDADRLRRAKEQIDADLAALYPKIAAGLGQ